MSDKIILTNVLRQKAEDLIYECTNTPEGERNYHFYIPFVEQVTGFLADLLGEADREQDEKELSKGEVNKKEEEKELSKNEILHIQITNDLKDFDKSIKEGHYMINPDEAIKDFKRIMEKVRKLI